jgi:hypothetical protein
MSQNVSYTGSYPHLEWIDLNNDGILVEVAVMKRDDNGNTYFFAVGSLDRIDQTRLVTILRSRNAAAFPLWDLMQSVTLGNGINALSYFHQLVRVLTPSGQIMDPSIGRIGAAVGTININQSVDLAASAPVAPTPAA